MRIGRRTFLRGFGTALALPWMESLAWSAPTPPRRMAFLFIPNGVHIPDWTPKQVGTDFYLPHLLDPLVPHKKDLLVLSGLTHNNARALGDGPGDHARSAACFLTGAHPVKTAGSNIRNGVSVDQIMAARVGNRTRFRSLELGCDPAAQAGNCDSGYSCAYSSNISWRTPTMPMAKEVNPRLVFERLFGLGAEGETLQARAERMAARKSILDYVGADAARLKGELGKTDRRKLDEYFAGVREIERRIETMESNPVELAGIAPPTGVPRDYREHVKLMCDLTVLAFRLDLTRVVTFMLANEGSNRTFPFLGIPEGHHHLSHHGGDKHKIAQIRKINRFQSEQFGYLIARLKEVKEGEGTLLDSSMVVFGSAISDGNRHNHDNLPIVLAGGGAGTVRAGRHVRVARDTPLCNLYVSLLERMDVPVRSFGDSTGPLALS
ncbi:MAG: DUF1552 domain-containing protein [Planctomycetota bacterium]|jgi:hypothetical protein